MIEASGKEILDIMRKTLPVRDEDYVVLVARRIEDNPFLLLVSIILSQNTSDKNSIKALNRFIEKIGTRCNDVLSHDIKSLEDAIKPAGLYRQKAKTIYILSEKICEVGEDFLVKTEPEELRKWLLSIPGIGKKTADVFLQLVHKAPYFAVDTHAFRIARRWGLAGEKATYDEVSRKLLEFFGADNAEEAHRLLIALGRRYCKAKKPRCSVCPLRKVCPHARRQSS